MSEVLSFKYPAISPAVGGNMEVWSQSLPINGSVFRSDQNQSMIFNVSSTANYIRTVQSFVTGNIVPRAADGSTVTSATTTNTTQGISRAFSRLVIRMGGAIIEDIQNYSDLLALYYATESLGKKSILTRTEGYNNTAFLQGGSTAWAHLIVSSLFVTPQCLPLPLIGNGGLSIELYLAPASEVFTSANVSYYTMEGVSYKYLALTPDPAYTLALRSAVNAGKSAYIPYQMVRAFPSNGNGSNTQLIQVGIGQKSSIVSIETVFWDSTAYNAADKGNRFTNANLTSWNVVAAEVHNPTQIDFQYGTNGGNPETLLTSLMSQTGNAYQIGNDVSIPTNFDTQNFRLALNFQSSNENFGTGMSTVGAASPFITIGTKHSQPVPSTTSILTFVTTDALLEFRGAGITIHEIF